MSRKKESPPASLDAALDRLEQRHRMLLGEIGAIGLVLRGTIGAHMMRCGKLYCRCKADPPALHGPYHLWTRKVAGKTVTVYLTGEQAVRYQEWTRNMHRLDRLVKELQALGLRAAKAVARSS